MTAPMDLLGKSKQETYDKGIELLLAKKATEEIVYQYSPEQKLSNIINAQI